jgi:hypothetical protein
MDPYLPAFYNVHKRSSYGRLELPSSLLANCEVVDLWKMEPASQRCDFFSSDQAMMGREFFCVPPDESSDEERQDEDDGEEELKKKFASSTNNDHGRFF